MNQQLIDQLLHKAGARFGAEGTDYSDFTSSKFAELIVKECLDIVNRKEYSYHEADPLWETSQLIKEHFGVEE
jgi:uncharacterized tellurite resistance protein B-like protein